MSCVNCQNKIERALTGTAGVESAVVSFAGGTAEVCYDPDVVSFDKIEDVITALGYVIESDVKGAGLRAGGGGAGGSGAARTAALLLVIVAAALIFNQFGGTLFNAFPSAEAGMSLAMMFLIGLITSVHCLAMCSGINLSQTLRGGAARAACAGGGLPDFLPSLLYNTGRVVSYTLIGALVGAAGAVFRLSGAARGLVQLAAGVFMFLMGLNMLGIFPALRYLAPGLPRSLQARLDAARTGNSGPFVIGLLNGLMPCGPLQAMQIYALSTGSAAKGALSMLLFVLGTVPLMFGLGVFASFLSGRFTRRVMTAGACVIAVMGLTMFNQGWTLSGFSLGALVPGGGSGAGSVSAGAGGAAARVVNGVQIVDTALSSGRYPAIIVQKGLPVRWNINAPAGSINGCNNRMVIPEYNIEYSFKTGDNIIEFTPEKTGKFRYSCWMGMIRSSITVVPDSAALAEAAARQQSAQDDGGAPPPQPAGYVIPTDTLAVAAPGTYQGQEVQRVSIRLTDNGFSPAVVVLQRGIPAEWTIENESAEEGSSALRVPLYTSIVPLAKNEKNLLYLMPDADFDFSTGDSIFFGFVKVVDDINNIDAGAVKAQAAGVETLVYSDEYFESGAGGGCGGCGARR